MQYFEGRVGHLKDIESPWANAGGVARSIEDVKALSQTGVGWVEAGSYTIEPRLFLSEIGQEPFKFDPSTGISKNRVMMENKGLDLVEQEIPELVNITHSFNKPLVVNIAPVSDDPISETYELVSRSYEAGADAVLVNAGCPHVLSENSDKLEELSYNPGLLRKVLDGLRFVTEKYKPVFLRLSPYDEAGHMRLRAAQAIWQSGVVSAVFTPNSWNGISGPATADQTAEETRLHVQYFSDTKIDVVRSGGVTNARELKRSLDLGAKAAAGSTFFFTSENWSADVNKLLSDLIFIESL